MRSTPRPAEDRRVQRKDGWSEHSLNSVSLRSPATQFGLFDVGLNEAHLDYPRFQMFTDRRIGMPFSPSLTLISVKTADESFAIWSYEMARFYFFSLSSFINPQHSLGHLFYSFINYWSCLALMVISTTITLVDSPDFVFSRLWWALL